MASGFTRKKVQSLTLGEQLQKLRSERRMSLSEIAKQTKIQVRYLELLESGEYAKLPADVYVRGFLRAYAQYCGVNEKALIRLYARERGVHENIHSDTIAKPPSIKKPSSPHRFIVTPRLLISLVTIALVTLGAVYLYASFDRFVSSPWLTIDDPLSGTTLESRSAVFAGKTEKDAHVLINDQPILVDHAGNFRTTIMLQGGTNTISVRSINKFDKESRQDITLYVQEADVPMTETSDQTDSAPKEEGLTVEISTRDTSVWVSVDIDGTTAYNGKIPAEATERFTGQEKISITSGIGNKTFVRVNGKEIGTLSDDANVVRDVTFTPNTIVGEEENRENM